VRAIEIADGRVGQIIGALTRRVTYSNEDWLVIADQRGEHDHPDPERSRIVFSIIADQHGARRIGLCRASDVCATVLTHVRADQSGLVRRAWPACRPAHTLWNELIFTGDAESSSNEQHTTNRGIACGLTSRAPRWAFTARNSPSSRRPTNSGQFFLGG
jgi:hypothetical protein